MSRFRKGYYGRGTTMIERWKYDKRSGCILRPDGGLVAEVAGAKESNFPHARGEGNARLIAAAPDMYNFVALVYELLTEDDDSGESTMAWHMTVDVARQILDRIDGKEDI